MKKNRIIMSTEALTLNDVFPRFVAAKIAEGVSCKTEKTYNQHWKCIAKHLDLNKSFDGLTQDDVRVG